MKFKDFCLKWAKEIVNDKKAISLGHKNEQLYAICYALAMERAYRYSENIDKGNTDFWHFPLSYINDVANHYYDAFLEGNIEELLKL